MSVSYKCSWNDGEATAAAAAPFLLFEGHPKWPRFDLTYAFETDFPDAAKTALLSALRRWEAVSQFRFTEIESPLTANLKIGLYSGDHCEDKPFDGPEGELLAHAFRPTSGMLHFDKEKPWSFGDEAQGDCDFETVVVHELGHILGLDHSEDTSAVMYKAINKGQIKRELQPDDIEGIKHLSHFASLHRRGSPSSRSVLHHRFEVSSTCLFLRLHDQNDRYCLR